MFILVLEDKNYKTENLKIYYIKHIEGKVIYSNLNDKGFADYININFGLGLGNHPTFKNIKETIKDYEIDVKEVVIDLYSDVWNLIH